VTLKRPQNEAQYLPKGQDAPDYLSELKTRYERVIEHFQGNAEAYFGASFSLKITPELIIRRPLSEVVKCAAFGKNKQLVIYMKFFRVDKCKDEGQAQVMHRIRNEVTVTKKLYGSFPENQSNSVPRMIAFFPEEMSIVTEECKGEQLLKQIANSAKGYPGKKVMDELSAYCHLVGQWLKQFQKTPAIDLNHKDTPPSLIDYVDIRLKRLLAQARFKEQDRQDVLRYLEQQLGQSSDEKKSLCPAHGDLSLSNILVKKNQVSVLDFAMYRMDTPYLDPSYFCHQLEDFLAAPFFRKKTISILQKAFLDAYDPTFDSNAPIFLAYRVRHIINRLTGLSEMKGLSLIKNRYQQWQYKKYRSALHRLIYES